MSDKLTPSILKLRSKLIKVSEFNPTDNKIPKFNPDDFVKAAKNLQKTLRPEEILLDASDKIYQPN